MITPPLSSEAISNPAPFQARPVAQVIEKSPNAFRTISEVADDLAVPQHVLRFWESKFSQIKPLKRGGGRRYYRPEDIQLIGDIKELLYNQGFTIRGVQKLLRENNSDIPSARSMVPDPQIPSSLSTLQTPAPSGVRAQQPSGLPADKRRAIESVLVELKSLREIIRQSGV